MPRKHLINLNNINALHFQTLLHNSVTDLKAFDTEKHSEILKKWRIQELSLEGHLFVFHSQFCLVFLFHVN